MVLSATLTTPPSVWTVTLDDGTERLVDPGPRANTAEGAVAVLAAEAEARAASLAASIASARAAMMARMAELRRRYVTDLPGQDMLYDAKRREAEAYLAAPDPDPALYPLLGSEVAAGRLETLYQSAQVVLGLGGQWALIAAAMETLRYATDDAIGAAASAEAVEATLAAFHAQAAAFA